MKIEMIVYVVVLVAVIPVIAFSVLRYLRRMRELKWRWAVLAEGLGLTWSDSGAVGPGELRGAIDGLGVRVYTFTRGGGRSRRTLTAIEVAFDPPLDLGLRLCRESVWSSLGNAVGLRDIETGDAAFDEAIKVGGGGGGERAVLRLLTPTVRQSILAFDGRFGQVEVDDEKVYHEESGVVGDMAHLEAVVLAQLELARAVAHARLESAGGHLDDGAL